MKGSTQLARPLTVPRALTFWPAPWTTRTQTIEMRPASNAYSIRSWPCSSQINESMKFFIITLLHSARCRLITGGAVISGESASGLPERNRGGLWRLTRQNLVIPCFPTAIRRDAGQRSSGCLASAITFSQIFPISSVVATCQPGASPPSVRHRIYERQHSVGAPAHRPQGADLLAGALDDEDADDRDETGEQRVLDQVLALFVADQ